MSANDNDVGTITKSIGTKTNSPEEVKIAKDALQRRLDAGDITKEDVEILQHSYKIMSLASFIGAGSSIPVWIALGRRVPPAPPIVRLSASLAMGVTGSFLGFTIGGVAGAMEVNKKMTDAPRKLQVFQQISIDAKRAIIEHRSGIPDGTMIEHRSGIPEPTQFIPPGEGASEGSVNAELRRRREEQRDNQEASFQSQYSEKPEERSDGPAAVNQPASWERLRTTRPQRRPELSPSDELDKAQAEFDAMLDRERRGGDDLDRWK